MGLTATRLRNCFLAIATCLLLMQLSALCAQGGTPVTTCGTMITEPGHYTVANDLLNCPADGIDILASNVELDLAGHQISGGDSGTGIDMFASHVRILGPGTINGFSVGVLVNFGSKEVDVIGVTANGSSVGFLARFAKVTFGGDTATGNDTGFLLQPSDDCELSGNKATGNSGNGFLVSGDRNRIHMNVARNNGASGINISTGSVDNDNVSNVALGNAAFDLSDGNATCANKWVHNTFQTANLPCIH